MVKGSLVATNGDECQASIGYGYGYGDGDGYGYGYGSGSGYGYGSCDGSKYAQLPELLN